MCIWERLHVLEQFARVLCTSFWTLFGTPFELAAKYNFQVRKLLPGDGNGSLGTEICGKVGLLQ